MHIACCSTEMLKHAKNTSLFLIDPVTVFISFDGGEEEEKKSSSKAQSHSHRVWENEFVPVARSLLNNTTHHWYHYSSGGGGGGV